MKNRIAFLLIALFTLLNFSIVLSADKEPPTQNINFAVSVEVSCDDSFTRDLIRGYILQELRNIRSVSIAEKGKDPQAELSISAAKTENNWVALSIMKVQHIWSKGINPSSDKHDYAIGRADHYVAVLPLDRLKQTCSEIVTEFDATYIESLRRWKETK